MTTFAFVCRTAEPAQTLHIARQAEALAIAGHNVDIFAPPWPALAGEITQRRVRIRSLGAAPDTHRNTMGALFFWLRVWLTISLAQFQRRYHVIQISGSCGFFVFTTWLAHLLGAKIALDTDEAAPERIMALTGAARESLGIRFLVLREQLVVDFVDHIIVTTEPLRGRYISRGCPPEKISVIYQTPDEERFGQSLAVERHENIAGRFLIVCHEEVAQQLDLETVIRAVATVRERVPNVLLWLVCPAEERPALSALVRQLDLKDAVLVQNAMTEEELPAFIAQADAHIVAMPRDSITDLLLPRGIFESLALGIPTIAVRTQATQYYFDARSLLVYDQGDVADLASRIEWLTQHPEARVALKQHTIEPITQMNWSRERHRYVALLLALAVADLTDERAPAEAAGFSRMSRRRSASIQTYRAALTAHGLDAGEADVLASDPGGVSQPSGQLPLRLTPLSHEWRTGQQFRLRAGAWLLRGLAAALLFGIPIVASDPDGWAKVVTALMFAGVAFVMLLLPPGEAAIIVALYFVGQRWIFLHFPPEGFLGRILVYLGTALQLVIFVGFCIRAIVQQRPLLRSGFILWPASLYVVASIASAFLNHVSPSVTLLGTEHTLHNLIFVVLIAEDLPTPIQLRRYVGVVLVALSGFAALSIVETALAFHWFGAQLPAFLSWFGPNGVPVSVIEPDPDSYAYLLNFGLLLAIAVIISLNAEQSQFSNKVEVPRILNALLIGATGLLTVAEFFTGSTENWLGLLAGTIALAFIFRGRMRLAVIGYLAVLVALSLVPFASTPTSTPTSAASNIIAIAQGQLPHNAPLSRSLSVVTSHPILGVGPGRFGGTVAYITQSPIYREYGFPRGPSIATINLFWVHIAGETGVIGLGIFVWLIFLTERAIWRAYAKGAHRQWHGITAGVFGIVIAMAVATFFGNALEIDSLSAPFWGLVGIAVALPIANRPLLSDAMPALRFKSAQEATDAADAAASNGALSPTRGG